MAQNLIQKLPPELCHYINLYNIYRHNFQNVMIDLVNTYWTKWLYKFWILDIETLNNDYNHRELYRIKDREKKFRNYWRNPHSPLNYFSRSNRQKYPIVALQYQNEINND